MNIYTRKEKWKVFLFAGAVLIVLISLFFANHLVSKLKDDEKKKVELWAGTIEKKANFVIYTNKLFDKIESEERVKVELWAKAQKELVSISNLECDLNFVFEVVRNNTTVPVILTDGKFKFIRAKNLDSSITNSPKKIDSVLRVMADKHKPIEVRYFQNRRNYLFFQDSKLFTELKKARDDIIRSFNTDIISNSANVPVIYCDSASANVIAHGNVKVPKKIRDEGKYLRKRAEKMKAKGNVLRIKLSDKKVNYVYYEDSYLLTQLKYYPYIQFAIIGLFLGIAYLMFSTSRKAEQNQVWVGMSKETAHQLGTPLSSLLAWMEVIREDTDDDIMKELDKDILRLQTITERFSKIGSLPKLEEISRYTKQLSTEEEEKIETITKNIMQKIIKLPVLQLKAACKRGEAETLIDVLNDLFNLEKEETFVK